MGKKRESGKFYSQKVVGIFALLALTASPGIVQAASVLNSCTTYCHGAPPRDAARKGNPHFGSQSSAFLGNHRNHLPAAADFASCSICHTPVAAADYGHQNNVVSMANSLKKYSSATLRARYDKGVFFNLTSIPNLTNATCSNVNCHFEKKTPLWGSAAYNVTTDCNACHGAPPAGTPATPAGGLAGSHARHDVYFPGTAGCQKCHPNSTTFTHATSAGRALKVQGFLRNPLNALEATGTYSGTGANYLPSKSASQVFGSCNNIYCHSSGQSATGTGTGITYKSVVWGGSALTCAGCHVDEATDATGTGSHKVHTISTGANYDCVFCHLGYTKTTVSTATHVNGLIELGAAGFTYSQGSGANHPAANGYGTCSVSTCHGTGTVTWGATAAAPVNGFPFSASQCDKCHSGTATAPFYSTAIPKVTANTNAKVGAHTSHLTAPDGLATAFACTDCHGTVVLNTATHMNGTTNFTWSALATKTGAITPTYTAATGACSNVYCHGASMPGGDASGSNRAPAWNSTTYLPTTLTAASCGTCHGFPPSAASGHPGVTIPAGFPATASIGTTCSCHSNINSAGNSYANIFVDKTLHINGTIDVSAGGGNCNSCHDFDTVGATYSAGKWSGGTWGKLNIGNYATANEGWGAHAQHINFIKTRLGIAVALTSSGQSFGSGQPATVCGTCHTNTGTHNMAATGGTDPTGRSINFGDGTFKVGGTAGTSFLFGASNPVYNGVSGTSSSSVAKTCSNISCHYFTTPLWSTY